MFGDTSMFGFVGNPVDQAAYDMSILAEIEKDDKELELRKLCGHDEGEDNNG